MPLKKTTTATKPEPTLDETLLSSLNPEEFTQGGGGRAANFWASIAESRFVPFNWGGKSANFETRRDGKKPDNYRLSLRFSLSPAEGESIPVDDNGVYHSYYSAGDLQYWVPSKDGRLPSGGDFESFMLLKKFLDDGGAELSAEEVPEYEGIYAIKTPELRDRENKDGKPQHLPQGSNCAFVLSKLVEQGVDVILRSHDISSVESDDVEFFWEDVEVPQTGLKQNAGGAQGNSKRTVLAPTQVRKKGSTVAATAKAGTTTTKPAAPASTATTTAPASTSTDNDELLEKLLDTLHVAAWSKPNKQLKMGQFASVIMASFPAEEQAMVIDLLKNPDAVHQAAYDNDYWEWDAKTKTITAMERSE